MLPRAPAAAGHSIARPASIVPSPGLGSIIVLGHREIPHLLDQQRRPGRQSLEAQLPLRQVRFQTADAPLLVTWLSTGPIGTITLRCMLNAGNRRIRAPGTG